MFLQNGHMITKATFLIRRPKRSARTVPRFLGAAIFCVFFKNNSSCLPMRLLSVSVSICCTTAWLKVYSGMDC